mmetsp:Transcript_47087/g.110982  ORF Transcript_47087/g.110982 Transcript_47087/m.110982 type:complete len:208 (-) Transcript_47087:2961-3584(-)
MLDAAQAHAPHHHPELRHRALGQPREAVLDQHVDGLPRPVLLPQRVHQLVAHLPKERAVCRVQLFVAKPFPALREPRRNRLEPARRQQHPRAGRQDPRLGLEVDREAALVAGGQDPALEGRRLLPRVPPEEPSEVRRPRRQQRVPRVEVPRRLPVEVGRGRGSVVGRLPLRALLPRRLGHSPAHAGRPRRAAPLPRGLRVCGLQHRQ